MKNFEIKEEGSNIWTLASGQDIYDAAEQYAEELDDEGMLTQGGVVKLKIRKLNVPNDTKEYSLEIYAELDVRYCSRDLKEGLNTVIENTKLPGAY